MKKIILIILVIISVTAFAQSSKKDSLLHEIDEHVKTVQKAADQFLNKALSTAERIKAIQPYALIYDENQAEQFKNVVLDNKEPPEIRATALNKIYRFIPGDERLGALTNEWLDNPQVPKVLRQEALRLEENLSFLSMDVPDVYQKMLEAPEPEFRMFAFTKLIVHGDARAQQKLIKGLEDPKSALLPAPDAIGILSMSPKKEYYPAVYRALLQTNDERTRLEAISALGFYKEAREKLINISRDTNEKEQFRESALGALYVGDRDNIVKYVSPILSDRSATPHLQIMAVQMTIDARGSMAYGTEKGSEYDLLIKSITEDKNRDPELKKIALEYMQTAGSK
jgi:HEAT repeat protein